jgi:hypothetical protein
MGLRVHMATHKYYLSFYKLNIRHALNAQVQACFSSLLVSEVLIARISSPWS